MLLCECVWCLAGSSRLCLIDPWSEIGRSEARKGEAQIGEVTLGVDQQRWQTGPQHLLDQDHSEAGLAGTGHADDHAVRRKVVGSDSNVGAGALVRLRIDRATKKQFCHGWAG